MNSYFLVGTKYQNHPGRWDNMFPEMVREGAVAVGFARHLNLSKFYGEAEKAIDEHLSKHGEDSTSRAALRKFLNIREGDWIALKGFCSPKGRTPRLLVSGYAIVTPRNGAIYRYSPSRLGHLLNVEFIETDISRLLRLGYGKTVHQFSDPSHIRKVFGIYSPPTLARTATNRRGTQEKNTSGHRVEITKSYVTRALHNKIQQSLYEDLRKRFGAHSVTMEREFVDIILDAPSCVSFYEVKPFNSAKQCIREAVGQLFEYAWFVHRPSPKPLRLVVVGPNNATKEDLQYLAALQAALTPWGLEYLHWP